MLFRPKCETCGAPSATIEVIGPHELPVEWASWSPARHEMFDKYRVLATHCFLYEGPGGSNGLVGNTISAERADSVIAAFTGAPSAEKIEAAGLYDDAGWCQEGRDFYCPKHWSISISGYGFCPNGHGKSLDPHWSP